MGADYGAAVGDAVPGVWHWSGGDAHFGLVAGGAQCDWFCDRGFGGLSVAVL